MAGKAKRTPTTEAQVAAIFNEVMAMTNPGRGTGATFDALLVIARGIDELRAEAKK